MKVKTFYSNTGAKVSFIGPDLDKGALPAVFYFALSAEDSLLLDPFNQIVQNLVSDKLRIFSMTLPGHENNLPKEKAIEVWATKTRNNTCPLSHFFDEAEKAITDLSDFITPNSLSFAGLSRGGFIAFHLAARLKTVQNILAFAPLVNLEFCSEFKDLKDHPIVKSLDTRHLTEDLLSSNIQIYIGNLDERVGTIHSFNFIQDLATLAQERRYRKTDYEMVISTSIGYLGHGTSPETFAKGATYLKNRLSIS